MIKNAFKSILALIIGHVTVFKHAFKKRVTLEYPEQKQELNSNFRGKHEFDFDKCIACGVCQRVCPANAITIIKQDNKLNSYIIDYNKCIFCGNCAFYCNTKAILMGNDYELATDNKDDLVVEFKKVKVAND